MAHAPQQSQVVLNTAAVWGTTVLATRLLSDGESLELTDGEGGLISKPDNCTATDQPIRAVAGGWQLDATGASGGALMLRGRAEDPAALGQGGPVPIAPGDHGLIQYGAFSVFFQFTERAPQMKRRLRWDWPLLLSWLFSVFLVAGVITLMWLLVELPLLSKPLELTSQEELAVRFKLDPETPPPSVGDDSAGKGIKDPGAKDKKEMGGGKKAKGDEGQLGRNDKSETTQAPGEIRKGLGAMSDALQSEVGQEIHETLGTISTVAEALGGLNSDSIVLGRGPGLGFRGSGSGGGGDTDGVPFGSGTMETGWGPGKGGGFGSGKGGPGGRGRGGFGKGGKGDGEGSGSGEKKIAGGGGSKPGQGLTPQQIQRVVLSRYGAFRACYESAAGRDPSLKGGVMVAWSITPGGSVTGARIASSSLSNARVEGCILRQFRRLKFPAADKGTSANYPFRFMPGKK